MSQPIMSNANAALYAPQYHPQQVEAMSISGSEAMEEGTKTESALKKFEAFVSSLSDPMIEGDLRNDVKLILQNNSDLADGEVAELIEKRTKKVEEFNQKSVAMDAADQYLFTANPQLEKMDARTRKIFDSLKDARFMIAQVCFGGHDVITAGLICQYAHIGCLTASLGQLRENGSEREDMTRFFYIAKRHRITYNPQRNKENDIELDVEKARDQVARYNLTAEVRTRYRSGAIELEPFQKAVYLESQLTRQMVLVYCGLPLSGENTSAVKHIKSIVSRSPRDISSSLQAVTSDLCPHAIADMLNDVEQLKTLALTLKPQIENLLNYAGTDRELYMQPGNLAGYVISTNPEMVDDDKEGEYGQLRALPNGGVRSTGDR